MSEFYADMRDIRFNLFDFLKLGDLKKHERFAHADPELISDILDMAFQQAAEVLYPINEIGDRVGAKLVDGKVVMPPGFKEAYKTYSESGWTGLSVDPEHGGQGLPFVCHLATQELFTAANVNFMFTPGLTHGAMGLIAEFGTADQKATYVEKMVTGEWAGTMCLTEPQAGTAVPDLKSTATPIEGREGFYKIKGQKIFISSGDHELTDNIIHLYLARVEGDPPGAKGVSLFVVPKYRVEGGKAGAFNDISTVALEEKLGLHGSATCQLSFGDNDDCEGWLLGGQGNGLKCMFKMMNEARIAVGIQGVGLPAFAYEKALRYSKERVQGSRVSDMKKKDADRVAIIEHPDVRRMLLRVKAISQAGRAMLYYGAYCFDNHLVAADEKESAHWMHQLEILTPIIKAWCSDEGFNACVEALQVFGGYGYIKEYGVEQLLRDAKIASIYEGTNGIQAMDLLGRKVARGGGVMMRTMLGEVTKFIEGPAKEGPLQGEVVALGKATAALGQVAMSFGQTMMKGDVDYPMMHATGFLQMFGDVIGSWLLTSQATIAQTKLDERLSAKGIDANDQAELTTYLQDDADARFWHGKVQSARFFANQILPRVRARAAQVKTEDRSALNVVF